MSVNLENSVFRLALADNGLVESLVLKKTGEELAAPEEKTAFFSVTQDRPFNNEVKLAHPNKHTVYQANKVEADSSDPSLWHVTFETVPVKANIRVNVQPCYILFTLEGFTVLKEDYDYLKMDTPPVAELRLCQLALRERKNFGEWLNVLWDETALVNVLATSPEARVDCEKRPGSRILTADAVREIRLEGCSAALIVSEPGDFLDAMAAFEEDMGLPGGAGARRSGFINRSVYWTGDLCPANVDDHIRFAKQGGFSMMLLYYTCFCQERRGYSLCGNYDFNEKYPNGFDDLRAVLKKIKDAGITPGFHFLQTHIGMESRYVTPMADRRLGKKQIFTLAKGIEADGYVKGSGDAGSEDGESVRCGTETCDLFVEEAYPWTVMYPDCRVLRFGHELMTYEGYVPDHPSHFTGVKRGAFGTVLEPHEAGQAGCILDMSEFGATSCYIDQMTNLQDEVADKLAALYNCGFEFCYMDGSEGTNIPFEYHVPNAQYRVYRKLSPAPLFTEGAAKAHFSWHFQAGANAFDIFPPDYFKEAIIRFPAAEAPEMRKDFTRLDFGWWGFWAPSEEEDGIQADMYEFGTSVAAAWNCPATMQSNLDKFRSHPRINDILEVMRRWEDVRKTGFLTEEMRAELKDTSKEHTLYLNERGEYELLTVTRMPSPAHMTVYAAPYHGQTLIIYWHNRGEGVLKVCLEKEVELALGERRYLLTALDQEAVREAFSKSYLTT